MSVSVVRTVQVSVVETLEGEFVGADNTVTINGLNASETLTSSTTPPVTKCGSGSKALSAGSATLDLTALLGSDGVSAVTLTGLKVASAIFKNPSTNANSITIAKGGSNGCTSFGSAFSITLFPGMQIEIRGNDNAPDIGGTDKTFDLTGTLAQPLQYQIVGG